MSTPAAPPPKDKRSQAQPQSQTRRVRGRDPVDTLARRVIAPAQEPAREVRLQPHERETPWPVIPWSGRGCRPEDDLRGQRRGLLRVVGYAGDLTRSVPRDAWNAGVRPDSRNRKRARWVLKCDCGVYLYMRTRVIKRLAHGACSRCRAKGLGS